MKDCDRNFSQLGGVFGINVADEEAIKRLFFAGV
jgi:hypothetical protein